MIRKRAQVVSMYDLVAVVILVLGMIIWLAILKYDLMEKNSSLVGKVSGLSDDELFMNILRAKIGDNQMADKVVEAYSNGKEGNLVEEIDYLLSKIYKDEVCWELYAENDIIVEKDCAVSGDELLDAKAYLPYIDGDSAKSIHVRLIIRGYKK
ncbi:hypothetical protein JXC34_05635 [Candidatus Woesearchaeota archaeon]|nr:hypothetical protein [Candidatus Woesearchaeota archaeon]